MAIFIFLTIPLQPKCARITNRIQRIGFVSRFSPRSLAPVPQELREQILGQLCKLRADFIGAARTELLSHEEAG